MIEGALTKAAFEKEKEQHKDDAIITYWYTSEPAQPSGGTLARIGTLQQSDFSGGDISFEDLVTVNTLDTRMKTRGHHFAEGISELFI